MSAAALRSSVDLRRALSGSGVLFAATMLVNAINYGYALVLGRAFGPSEYGSYASFMSLFLLASLLPLTLQQVNARYAATGASVLAYTSRLALGFGFAFGTVLVATSGPLGAALNLSPLWLIGLGLALPPYTLLGALRGEVQGRQAFAVLGGNLLLEHGLKIALTPLALLLAPMSAGAVLATLVALPLSLLQLTRRLQTRALALIDRAAVRRYAVPIFVGVAAQAMIVNSDVLMVNALLPAEEAGSYAAVALVGRVVFYGSWAVGAALFPLVARRQRDGVGHRDLLLFALIGVGFAGFGITGFCALFPSTLMTLLFGDAYLGGASLLAPYAFMTTLFALANVVSSHYLALGSRLAGFLLLAAAVLQIGLVALMHGSGLQVVHAQMLVKGALLAVLLLGAALGRFEKGSAHVVR